MEPDEKRIADIARETGATEAEARAIFHIREASAALRGLPSEGTYWVEMMLWFPQADALLNYVLGRIARRDHPEGWPQPRDDGEG